MSDALNLEQSTERQGSHLHTGTRWLVSIEEFGINGVDALEISHVHDVEIALYVFIDIHTGDTNDDKNNKISCCPPYP